MTTIRERLREREKEVPPGSLYGQAADTIDKLVAALDDISGADIIELNLDPDWPRRISREALRAVRGE
jgi:hypothetical protein